MGKSLNQFYEFFIWLQVLSLTFFKAQLVQRLDNPNLSFLSNTLASKETLLKSRNLSVCPIF